MSAVSKAKCALVEWLRSLLRCSIFGKLQQKDRREAPAHKVALGHLDQTFFDKAFLSFPMRLSEDINVVKFHDPNNHPSSSFIILDPLFYFFLALRNPAYGVWPKCLWLQRELRSFLERLPPTADAKELHEGHSPE